MSPHWPLLAIGVWLGLAWALFLAIDIPNVGGLGDALGAPTWWPLFNDRPVEWTQWLVLPLAILCAGYVAGRLGGTPRRGGAMFFLLMGAGLGLMLFEEAGDVRHMIGAYVRELIGQQIYGSPYQVVFELPYFAVIALLPVYAVLRYGRSVWRAPSARGYLVAAVGLYGLAAMGSGLRHLGDFYRPARILDRSVDPWWTPPASSRLRPGHRTLLSRGRSDRGKHRASGGHVYACDDPGLCQGFSGGIPDDGSTQDRGV